tara:strand:- start:1130 stop:2404 length:1275 start_codon:yes stop_codon:yes gene_type:complete
MNLKQRVRIYCYALTFLCSGVCLFSQSDSLTILFQKAENAFLLGQIEIAADNYVDALEFSDVETNSNADINNRLKIIELLSLCLQQIGNCEKASNYLKPLMTEEADKVAVSKAIREIIRCTNANGTKINEELQQDILEYLALERIDEGAENQMAVFLKGVYTDEQDFSDFFLLLEYGFMPALKSLEKEQKANRIADQRSYIAIGSLFLMLILGFFLFTANRQINHVIRENVALLTGKEKETNRLSVDLHDILGYKIVELKDQVKKVVNGSKPEMENISKGLNELHESMRYIVQSNLTPESLKFGLGPALDTLFNRVNKLGVLQFELYKHGLKDRLNEEKEKHIFYIIQELVNNVIKHSKGTRASFEISSLESEVSILAEDDGIGYISSIDTLKTVKSRVGFLKGKVVEESEIDKGSMVIVTVPI